LNKKTLIIAISSVVAISLISGVVVLTVSRGGSPGNIAVAAPGSNLQEPEESDDDFTYIPPTLENPVSEEDQQKYEEEIEKFVPATEMDLDPTSITVYVNKEYALPKDYKPDDLVTPDVKFNLITYDDRTLLRQEAADALEKLFAAAEADGYNLCGISGFRSYDRQKKIFTNNIATKGKEHTLKYSAVPGTSEHQTGLAIDISTKSQGYDLSPEFANSPEGKWVAENAYRFGYIIRYPLGKAEITGYAYEPWHIRYVGIGLANYLYENDLTLDEYYKYTPSPDFNFEAKYAEFINYVPPVVTTVPVDGEDELVDENGEIIEGEDGKTPDGETTDGEDIETPDTENPDEVPGDVPEDGETPDDTKPGDGQNDTGNGQDTDPDGNDDGQQNPGTEEGSNEGGGPEDTPTPTPPTVNSGTTDQTNELIN
jgi:zinc D-Ala-D-Ala carboxypeptidase